MLYLNILVTLYRKNKKNYQITIIKRSRQTKILVYTLSTTK